MRRKKFKDIKTKEDRQEFLQYMLDKELEKIRKKIYKYQRRDILYYPVIIEEIEFETSTTAGRYFWDEENEIHKIQIKRNLVGNYISQYYRWWHPKSRDKFNLIDTIGHEIVHAFVKERFEHVFSKIKYKNRDASPVFLMVLQYLGYTSGHHCEANYTCSQMWRDIQDLKSKNAKWDEVFNYILLYLKEIESLRQDLNKKYEYKNIEDNVYGQTIDFDFSARGSGLRKMAEVNLNIVGYVLDKKKFTNAGIKNTTFEIGSMINADEIKKLIYKKLTNGMKADIHVEEIKKMSCIDGNNNSVKWLYDKRETYNKYSEQKTAQVI
jgi:hypothetical protein